MDINKKMEMAHEALLSVLPVLAEKIIKSDFKTSYIDEKETMWRVGHYAALIANTAIETLEEKVK